jgi:hypothetical protein
VTHVDSQANSPEDHAKIGEPSPIRSLLELICRMESVDSSDVDSLGFCLQEIAGDRRE